MALDMGGFAESGLPVRTDPATRENTFIDMRAGGSSRFSVSKTGVLSLPLGTAVAPSLIFSPPEDRTGMFSLTAGIVGVTISGTEVVRVGVAKVSFSTSVVGFGANLNSNDVAILRDGAAGILAQRVGTAAQIWRIYNTWTDASNYERLSTVCTVADDFKIIPEAAGTGTLRGLQIGVSGGKLGFYGTTAVTKPTALTASDGTLANAVIRQGELEAKLQSLGLLT